MKRCPQCYETYDDAERFCESDGQQLLADPTFSPESDMTVPVAPTRPVWLPAAALGVLVGLAIGVAIFAAVSFSSPSVANEPQPARQTLEGRETAFSRRERDTLAPAPAPEPEESPSPEAVEEEAETEPSPTANAENRAAAAQLNQGPISTGQKTRANENETGQQTVIEMQDGSTFDVDAAWEDKQGIWYRRSGLVSFIESSRVKAITTRKGAKTAELQER